MVVFYFKTHAVFGVGLTVFILQYFNFNVFNSAIILLGAFLGSILPDGDHRFSPAGLIFPFWIFMEHRTWTHSIWIVLIEIGVTYGLYIDGSNYYIFFFGVAIGTITHLLIDSFTKSGIKLFYGISNKKFGFKCFKSAGRFDNAVFSLLGALGIYMRFFK